ncbi:unnamed protein product [Echinostoma caproni]|uniref:Uncharacterized protein n=1 Tax=Echinostoma caproni TaxID=27848 RepID=A0A183AM10_9TREM|nr:unnamed protein product [Echinostoma caproni]
MPAVVLRHSRMSRSPDRTTDELFEQTPIERVVHQTVNGSLQSNLKKQWKEGSSLGNIPLLQFHGSYRIEQINKAWDSPDMSRLPLHCSAHSQESVRRITALCSKEETEFSQMKGLRDRRKIPDVVGSTEPDVDESLYEDEIIE